MRKALKLTTRSVLRKQLLKDQQKQIRELWEWKKGGSDPEYDPTDDQKKQFALVHPSILRHWEDIRRWCRREDLLNWRDHAKVKPFEDTPDDLLDKVEDTNLGSFRCDCRWLSYPDLFRCAFVLWMGNAYIFFVSAFFQRQVMAMASIWYAVRGPYAWCGATRNLAKVSSKLEAEFLGRGLVPMIVFNRRNLA